MTTIRVAVATPLPTELRHLITDVDPGVELLVDDALLPPMRYPGDHDGDPGFRRTPQQQIDFDALLARADILYGIPDTKPVALAPVVRANPGLRWVHTMAAGGGGQVKAAGLTQEQLRRIAFTTSAGVHGGPLAEFAVFGLFAGAKDLRRLLDQQLDRNWSGRWEMRQVSEMTILVVGLGGIGQEVVKKLSGLGPTVIGTSRHGIPVEHVDRLIKVEDIVSAVPEV